MVEAHAVGGVPEAEPAVERQDVVLAVQHGLVAAGRLRACQQVLDDRPPDARPLPVRGDGHVLDVGGGAAAVQELAQQVQRAGADDAAVQLGDRDERVRVPPDLRENGGGRARIDVAGGAEGVERLEEAVAQVAGVQLADAEVGHARTVRDTRGVVMSS